MHCEPEPEEGDREEGHEAVHGLALLHPSSSGTYSGTVAAATLYTSSHGRLQLAYTKHELMSKLCAGQISEIGRAKSLLQHSRRRRRGYCVRPPATQEYIGQGSWSYNTECHQSQREKKKIAVRHLTRVPLVPPPAHHSSPRRAGSLVSVAHLACSPSRPSKLDRALSASSTTRPRR